MLHLKQTSPHHIGSALILIYAIILETIVVEGLFYTTSDKSETVPMLGKRSRGNLGRDNGFLLGISDYDDVFPSTEDDEDSGHNTLQEQWKQFSENKNRFKNWGLQDLRLPSYRQGNNNNKRSRSMKQNKEQMLDRIIAYLQSKIKNSNNRHLVLPKSANAYNKKDKRANLPELPYNIFSAGSASDRKENRFGRPQPSFKTQDTYDSFNRVGDGQSSSLWDYQLVGGRRK